MSTGQMLLVLGAVTLLSTLSITINTMLIGQTASMLDAEASLNAVSIGQSMLDEVMSKYYDAVTAPDPSNPYKRIWNATGFTALSGFGPNATESRDVSLPDTSSPFKSVAKYNDIDDYHRYSRIVSTSRMGGFTVYDSVTYVSESSPDTRTTSQTFFKKIVVRVNHMSMKSPLELSDVAIYRTYF